jgi:homoserine O-acetyltransferase
LAAFACGACVKKLFDNIVVGGRYVASSSVGGVALLAIATATAAHTPSQPPHQLFSEGDLKLESGEVLKDFSISHVTHGTLNAKKSNAILVVTAISGNHRLGAFWIM